MATEIRVPKIAASAAKASIGRWFKRVGDPVSVDEPLVEIETDGTTVRSDSASYRRAVRYSFERRQRRKGRYVAGNDYRVREWHEDPWCALNVSKSGHSWRIGG